MLQPHETVHWKGPTFSQIAPVTKYNIRAPNSNVFRALPSKHYRKELPVGPDDCSRGGHRNPGRMAEYNQPGGIVTNTSVTALAPAGTGDVVAPIIPPLQSCSVAGACVSTQNNALSRVRSAGMTKKGVSAANKYYSDNRQYLQSRNRTVYQNGIHILRQGDATSIPGTVASYDNVYASGTIAYCPGAQPGESTKYYPVHYHPSNYKYGTQGAVSAGEKILRLKYDTVTYGGQATNTPFGVLAPSNLAYALGADTYRLKDKLSGPFPCTPGVKYGKLTCAVPIRQMLRH